VCFAYDEFFLASELEEQLMSTLCAQNRNRMKTLKQTRQINRLMMMIKMMIMMMILTTAPATSTKTTTNNAITVTTTTTNNNKY
jgi:hypothetical protein